MGRESASLIVLLIILTVNLSSAIEVQSVEASGTIYIRADGSIDPPDAPISTIDNVTYTLTGTISSTAGGIIVERDDVVIDWTGFTVEGAGTDHGIFCNGRHNVTLQDSNINGFYRGISLSSSSDCSIIENNVTNNGNYGVWLAYARANFKVLVLACTRIKLHPFSLSFSNYLTLFLSLTL